MSEVRVVRGFPVISVEEQDLTRATPEPLSAPHRHTTPTQDHSFNAALRGEGIQLLGVDTDAEDILAPLFRQLSDKARAPHYIVERLPGVIPHRTKALVPGVWEGCQIGDDPPGFFSVSVPIAEATPAAAYMALQRMRQKIAERIIQNWKNVSTQGHLITMVYTPICMMRGPELFAEFEVQWVPEAEIPKVLSKSKVWSEKGVYPIDFGDSALLNLLHFMDLEICESRLQDAMNSGVEALPPQEAVVQPPPRVQEVRPQVSVAELRELQEQDRVQRREILRLKAELFELQEKIRVEPFKAFMEAGV